MTEGEMEQVRQAIAGDLAQLAATWKAIPTTTAFLKAAVDLYVACKAMEWVNDMEVCCDHATTSECWKCAVRFDEAARLRMRAIADAEAK